MIQVIVLLRMHDVRSSPVGGFVKILENSKPRKISLGFWQMLVVKIRYSVGESRWNIGGVWNINTQKDVERGIAGRIADESAF